MKEQLIFKDDLWERKNPNAIPLQNVIEYGLQYEKLESAENNFQPSIPGFLTVPQQILIGTKLLLPLEAENSVCCNSSLL